MSKENETGAGEWTVDKENKQLIAPTGERFSVGFASMDSEPLAKLINAALAAEREKRIQAEYDFILAGRNNEQLRKQLATASEHPIGHEATCPECRAKRHGASQEYKNAHGLK